MKYLQSLLVFENSIPYHPIYIISSSNGRAIPLLTCLFCLLCVNNDEVDATSGAELVVSVDDVSVDDVIVAFSCSPGNTCAIPLAIPPIATTPFDFSVSLIDFSDFERALFLIIGGNRLITFFGNLNQ